MAQRQEEHLYLGSAYFVVFERIREQLEDVLRAKGGLNLTQFRLFLKASEQEDAAPLLSELAEALRLQPNVVSQAANILEQLGLIVRVASPKDARAKSIKVTPHGRLEIERINAELRDRLYESFNPTADPLYKTMLEATIICAAEIEESLSHDFIEHHLASAALITYGIVEQSIVDSLREATGASFSECRILQRLAETGEPMRAVDLANQLALPPTTITRSATRLEKRGWLLRLASGANLQAVFLDVTEAGKTQQEVVLSTIDRVATRVFWNRLDAEHRDAVNRVGDVFSENMRARDCIRRHAILLEDLKPLVR